MYQGREEKMTLSGKDDNVLKKTKRYVKYHQLLTKAREDGRIGGEFKCPVCGMRYHTSDKADNCCRIDEESL